jgi:hypothetical protein
MPDPILILWALGAAAGVAALALLRLGWPWRAPHPESTSAGWVLGVGAGFYLGCRLLGLWPHWPPGEDQDRFLALVLPSALAVELIAPCVWSWLAWLLRLVVAAGAARVLLHNTIYLTDLAGPGTQEWSPDQAWLILGGLGAALAAVWAALVGLAARAPGRSVPAALVLACGASALAVMLSGYSTGGQLGLPLAAALAGAAVASLVLSGPPRAEGALGVGTVGLFGLLVIGRFFGQLTTTHAALLFAAPLLAWLPELPYVCRLGPRLRGAARVALVAVPLAVAVAQAQQKFAEESRTSPAANEPSLEDYMDFGK